jgi:phosphatidylglycerophosphate synthase
VTLAAWSFQNACLLLAATALALALGAPWPLAAAASFSFVRLLARQNALTPRGGFGLANGVTLLRLALVLALGTPLRSLPEPGLAALVALIFALDGLDGLLARKLGASSAFGAHFDMETDALLVSMVTLLLFQRGDCAAWVLCAGPLRYLYVVTLALVPARGGEMPRTRLGRYAFAALMMGLISALALPGPLGRLCALLGSAAVVWSFGRSFYWSYARPRLEASS